MIMPNGVLLRVPGYSPGHTVEQLALDAQCRKQTCGLEI
jgi:hypothetical protein